MKGSAAGKTKIVVKHEPGSKPLVRKAGGKVAVKQEGDVAKRVVVKQEDKVEREKKVFEKLGQKKETPEVRRLPVECVKIVQGLYLNLTGKRERWHLRFQLLQCTCTGDSALALVRHVSESK